MKQFNPLFFVVVSIFVFFLLFAGGCGIGGAPRGRLGTLPTPPPGPRFSEPNSLGGHSYGFSPFETNAVVYTCNGGHIDVSHLRCNADHTRYIIKKIRGAMSKGKEFFKFNLSWERSVYEVHITYPDNWDEYTKQEKLSIINDISLDAGAYVAFNAGIWHEILTWFGVHFAGFEPEFNSAFTWEDIYSNLLGVDLAVEAVAQNKYSYNKAMTMGINREIESLGPQSKNIAIYASSKMRGKWYKGVIAVETIRKNMDIGLDDGLVSPVLVPGICDNAAPIPRPVPNLDSLSQYGFGLRFEIYPQEWERGKIYKALGSKPARGRIKVQEHYPVLMEFIRNQAVKKYGYIIEE